MVFYFLNVNLMAFSRKNCLQLIFLIAFWGGGIKMIKAQSSDSDEIILQNDNPFYIETEVMLGKLIPVYPNYPSSSLQKSIFFNFGNYNNSPKNPWASFYKRPFTGTSIAISDFGNRSVFGYGISILPYVIFHTPKLDRPAWHFKFGLGASFYTKTFDQNTNPENESVSSPYTWAFKLFIYRDVLVRPRMRLKIGTGWLHGSNGHTELPNFGINSAMLSIAAQFYKQPVDWGFASAKNEELTITKKKEYFFLFRTGLGVHELGGPSGPVGGPKKFIHVYSASAGKIVKDFIKLRVGLVYRYYDHFHDFIVENALSEFNDQPTWNASNINLFFGSEFLMGHFSLDAELGFNLFKPFYQEQYRRFEKQSDVERILKTILSQRLGLNYYFINTNKKPIHNFNIGFHINANFGQADFTELSLAYTYRL